MPPWSAAALAGLDEVRAAYRLNPADMGILQQEIDTYFTRNPVAGRHRFRFQPLLMRNAAVDVAFDGDEICDVQYGD